MAFGKTNHDRFTFLLIIRLAHIY